MKCYFENENENSGYCGSQNLATLFPLIVKGGTVSIFALGDGFAHTVSAPTALACWCPSSPTLRFTQSSGTNECRVHLSRRQSGSGEANSQAFTLWIFTGIASNIRTNKLYGSFYFFIFLGHDQDCVNFNLFKASGKQAFRKWKSAAVWNTSAWACSSFTTILNINSVPWIEFTVEIPYDPLL